MLNGGGCTASKRARKIQIVGKILAGWICGPPLQVTVIMTEEPPAISSVTGSFFTRCLHYSVSIDVLRDLAHPLILDRKARTE